MREKREKRKVHIEKDSASFYRRLAEFFCDMAIKSVSARGWFDVALSGGDTPRPLHRLLAVSPYIEKIPWAKTHIFWVDERCVPVDDDASNFGNAKKDLIDKVPIPGAQVHPMDGSISPEKGARAYEKLLKCELKSAGDDKPAFDLVLLGLGTDGHVASLFPEGKIREDENRWVIAPRGGTPCLDRLTLTLPAINQGKTVMFMVLGQAKAAIVKTVFENPDARLPAQQVNPQNGKLIWVLDQEAASLVRSVSSQGKERSH
jgi:6-phosphogluconolactonase